MASIRKSWTGSIKMGPVEINVVAKPATGSDPRSTGLQRLCACHEQPFAQTTKCPGGKLPTSEAAIKRGDSNLADVVYGVLADDDTYVVLAADVLAEIEDLTVLDFMQIEETVPRATADNRGGFPLHLGVKAYFLAYDKDGDAAAPTYFAALHAALAESGDVAVAKWSQRGPQSLVGIHASGEALMLTLVPFGAQVREPDALCVAHTAVRVGRDDQAAVTGFLAGMRSDAFDHDSYEDDAAPRKAEAIDKALDAAKKGKKVSVKKAAAAKKAPAAGASLADLLGKSVQQADAKKAARKPAAKKPVAKAGRR